MKDYVPIIVAAIAGLFTIACAYFAWKLKQSSENLTKQLSQKEQRHNELKLLYIKTHEHIENLIKSTREYENIDLNSKFSVLTAEIRMVASAPVVEKYLLLSDLYNEWAAVYRKAYPPRVNGILTIQAPDPTAKFKEPEKITYEKFYNEYESLVKIMREELV